MILVFCASMCSAIARSEERQLEFIPRVAFAGHSVGDGSFSVFLLLGHTYHVENYGYVQADETFRLNQSTTSRGRPPTARFWIIKNTGANNFTATLSEAAGPVTGHAEGARLFLSYRIKGPLVMHQQLELMPDGKTIDNVGRITLLGIPVGRLHETITRIN